ERSIRVTVEPGQRAATARAAAPAPEPRSASLPAKEPGTAAANIIASTPARWPRRAGCTSQKAPRWKASSVTSCSAAVSVILGRSLTDAGIPPEPAWLRLVGPIYPHATRQDAERAFHDAHIVLGDKKPDLGIAQQAFDERNQNGIVGSYEFYHAGDVCRLEQGCKRR